MLKHPVTFGYTRDSALWSMLKERAKQPVTFAYFRDGALWYSAFDGWVFPVPVADTENAQGVSPTFNVVEKGITLMRWMRKAMEAEKREHDAGDAQKHPPLSLPI